MADRQWTREQKDAISAEGTLLVSAAAGSGKTAVLVERVIRKITDRSRPCDADRLLVVTFTNAAAAEMRERVANRLADLIAQRPDDLYLQRQQILLQNAHISTIHSFCLELIRENFEKLDIPADFRISDENEIGILRREVLEEVLEQRYAADIRGSTLDTLDDKPFIMLTEMLGSGRDDAALADTVLRLYHFIRSLPDPESWLNEKLGMYDPDVPVSQSAWGRAAAEYVADVLRSLIVTTEQSIRAAQSDERMQKAYGDALYGDLASLRQALAAACSPDLNWDALREACSFPFARLGQLRKFEDEALKERVTGARKGVKDTVAGLQKSVLCCSSAEFTADMQKLRPVAGCLFETVRQLSSRLFEEKLKRNLLDFSDLEQLALKLLVRRTGQGFEPTKTARKIAERFDEVLVDEYQDTNSAQDTIFRAISRDEGNFFMVGDVKQSIYRFRQAMPEIFIGKKERFAPYGSDEAPAKIILGRNFRSRAGVTDAVNFVFNLLMSKGLGEIDYGAEDLLIPAASYPERLAPSGEAEPDFALHIVDATGYEGEEDRTVLEARHIARVIRQMIEGGYTVSGAAGQRRATYRDFCILMRSTSGKAEKYMRELTANGIPVYADIAGGYLGSYEVAVILSLLRVLDNPLQDVPLLSVMFSPVFGFEADDLAKVRVANRKKSLYLALTAYVKEHDGGKFADFLALLTKLRGLAAVLPADKLILRIYDLTGFDDICSAMPGGEKRRANLRLLLDYARLYESAGYKGLSGFIRFIDRLSEQSGDLAPAADMAESADVVRIMTIHKSKGLEYPVCILADCFKPFNTEDTRKPAIFHPVYGFGSIIRDQKLNCYYTTLPKEVVRLETQTAALSEELRVLYVAMTRAREKLIAVMTLPNMQSTVKKAASMLLQGRQAKGVAKLLPFSAAQANNYAEWLLCCALSHPSCGELRSLAALDGDVVVDDGNRWSLTVVKAGESADAAAGMGQSPRSGAPEQEVDPAERGRLKAMIAGRVAFRYPYQAVSSIPSKVAVSEFAERSAAEFDAAQIRPAFLSDRRKLTGAQAGTALHAFMQYARLETIQDSEQARAEVRRLVEQGFLLPEQGEAVDVPKVLGFLRSGLYARVRSGGRCYKEFKFNLDIPADELYNKLWDFVGRTDAQAGDDSGRVMLQGMADLVFEEDGGFTILDYKTDHVGQGDGEERLKERYALQLRIYSQAVGRILGRPVQGTYIYSFALGKAIPV